MLVQGIDFELEAGDGLGIVGSSGSGKTSLVRAIVGVWPVHAGAVRFDGATMSQYTEEVRGRFVGYLPQDVELFAGSIAENIARFDPEGSMEAVVDAAKLAGVHQLVVNMPDGYGTTIGDGGARLSAGQRQRIGLARALYGSPFLVVLDEPNSNLDTEGEKALAHALKEMRARGSVVIVVAHRTSALSAVNKLLRIEGGQQVAFGDRDEILAANTVRARPAASSKGLKHAV